MGKAATFICVIALGTLLLAETGEVISSIDADENASLDSNVAATSREENFEKKKTRFQVGDVLEKETNETVVDSESEDGAAEEISVTKTPGRTNNNRRDDGINGRESERDNVEEISTKKDPRRRERKREKGNKKRHNGNVSAGGKGSRGPKLKNGQGGGKRRNTTEENSPTNVRVSRLLEDPNDTDGIEPNKSVCAAPPEIEGAIAPRLEGTEHAVGTAIAYSCNFGYVSRNSINHMSFCKYNETTERAQWTAPEIKCIPRSCGDPGYLNNGRRIGNLFTFPNKVEYECEEGYKLKGLRARYCQAGGDWSGRLPTCELIYCSVPRDPVNGRVRYSSLEYGTELRYECDVGYMVKKHEPRICSEDGSWSNEEPECIEARCEAPQSPEHGSVKLLGELKVGTLATYSCDHGRKLVGATTTKCLITGQWTFDAPQCLSTCKVSFISNGEMGRIRIRYAGRNAREEFVKVNAGEEIDSNGVLFFRCKVGYSPAEDSKILEGNLLEVTCIDGIWSRNLQCLQNLQNTHCNGEPPPTKNGIPIISSRAHGHTIWYECRRKDMTKVVGNVTCHFGNWIGVPPKCLDGPCYMQELNFPGLVKPLVEHLESREYFDIHCEYGFRRANSLSRVTCNRGKWDQTQNPCIRDTELDRVVSPMEPARTPPPREVPHSVYVTPSNPQIPDVGRSRECFCTYDYENDLVKTKKGGQPLNWGDSITQGEKVSIECLYSNLILAWQNGFRFYGKVNMTCDICENWQRKDLPDCSSTHSGDVVIGSEVDFKMSLGGIVHISRGQAIRFFCSSLSRQPQWNYRGRASVRVHETHHNVAEGILFITYMDIMEADDNNNGQYVCYTQNDHGHSTSTLLDLRVDDVYCPLFTPSNGLNVSYSNGNKYSSWATFSCPANAKLIGNQHSLCKQNGMWSETQPHCKFTDYVSCPRFPLTPELTVKYSNRQSVGSIATFSCSSPARNLIGSDVSSCQDDGTWSNPSPSCSEPGCSIGELSSSIPQTVEPDMTGVTSEFVPSGSEIRLKCSDSSILKGDSKVLCGEDGKWKLRNRYECVPGCILNIDPSSHLLIYPVQDSYRLGDFVVLSCPPGEEMSTNVERVMCLGGNWTDSLPFCKESKKNQQP